MTVGELFANYDKADGMFDKVYFTHDSICMTDGIEIRKIPEFWNDKTVIRWTTVQVCDITVEVEI